MISVTVPLPFLTRRGLKEYNNKCSLRQRKTEKADMAELADAPDLGSGTVSVGVQVPLSAPEGANLNTPKRILHFFEKVVAVVLKFSK